MVGLHCINWSRACHCNCHQKPEEGNKLAGTIQHYVTVPSQAQYGGSPSLVATVSHCRAANAMYVLRYTPTGLPLFGHPHTPQSCRRIQVYVRGAISPTESVTPNIYTRLYSQIWNNNTYPYAEVESSHLVCRKTSKLKLKTLTAGKIQPCPLSFFTMTTHSHHLPFLLFNLMPFSFTLQPLELC